MLSGAKGEWNVPEIKVRFNRSTAKKMPKDAISSASKVADFMRSTFPKGEMELQEHFVVLMLDTKLHPIGYYRHSVGTRNQSVVDGSQIVAVALKANANALVIAHNHPSGSTTPSAADFEFTKQIKAALKSQNIDLLDHVIITRTDYYSMDDDGSMDGLSGWRTMRTQSTPMKATKPKKAKALNGVATAEDLMNASYDVMHFNRVWSEIMQNAPSNFQMAIYGLPKNGKTVLATKLANYLTNFGPVHYNFADQGFTKSTQDILRLADLHDNPRVTYSKVRTLAELEKVIGDAQFVFVDLIDKYGLTPQQFDDFVRKHPDKSFIRVFATTKDGNFRGDNNWMHDLDQIVQVKDFVGFSTGRYGGGEFIIWDRAQELED